MKKRWMGLVVCLAIGQVQAASFDCGKASMKVEKLICADEKLSRLDEQLAAAYVEALKSTDPARLKAEQKAWLKGRNQCADVACIEAAYRQRTRALSQSPLPAAPAAQPAPPIQSPLAPAATEPACLPPRIDWRNYEWTLITGNGMTACEEMLAYLKARPKEAPPPVCPEERLPPNGNWTRPESRILSEAEKQALIRDVPEKWRKDYEQEFKRAELMRVIRADITRDGIPEMLLAYSQHDYRKTCRRAAQCASEIDPVIQAIYKHYPYKEAVSLHGGYNDHYGLLPMNDAGTQVDWNHRLTRAHPMLQGGELVYYKVRPYQLSYIEWSQITHDDFAHSGMRANNHYSRIFELAPLEFLTQGAGYKRGGPVSFADVHAVLPDENATCHFGYFHRDNLKLNPPKTRR